MDRVWKGVRRLWVNGWFPLMLCKPTASTLLPTRRQQSRGPRLFDNMAGNGIGDVSGMPFRLPIVAFNYGAESHGQPKHRHLHGKTSEKMGIPIRTGDDHDQAGTPLRLLAKWRDGDESCRHGRLNLASPANEVPLAL